MQAGVIVLVVGLVLVLALPFVESFIEQTGEETLEDFGYEKPDMTDWEQSQNFLKHNVGYILILAGLVLMIPRNTESGSLA